MVQKGIKMKKIYVYYAQTSVDTAERELYPRERMEEILECKNESVRREKYSAWKLLEHAINDAFSLDFDNLQFAKLDSGQWVCDKCSFSISHSDGVAAVAVSDASVGVDIEPVRAIDQRLASKVLTDSEYEYYSSLGEDDRANLLLECWCKKEAIFKAASGSVLLPKTIECSAYHTVVKRMNISQREYVIALASVEPFSSDTRS